MHPNILDYYVFPAGTCLPNLPSEQRVDGVEPLVELLLVGRLHEEAAVLGGDAERALGQGLQTIAIRFLMAIMNRPR